tara:strand:+ start:3960 stop:8156 length:4197 start_codon:yes stop_codon:yes gene_type:complete
MSSEIIIKALRDRFNVLPSQCSAQQPLFDAAGREYMVVYKTLPTSLDGRRGAIASNLPDFKPNKEYLEEFQARDLSSVGESAKIRKIANKFDPTRMLVASGDPTLGAPVVWEDNKGKHFVLAGNGRTIAFLIASDSKYKEYVKEAEQRWFNVYNKQSKQGFRSLLVRQVFHTDGTPLSIAEAIQLAGASQESTAGKETPLRQALSRARGLGITKNTKLGEIANPMALSVSTVERFINGNVAFTNSILDLLPEIQAAQLNNITLSTRPIALDIITSVLVGKYMPPKIISQGFGSDKEEIAIISVLPSLAALDQKIKKGKIFEEFDLLPKLETARQFMLKNRYKSYSDALADYQRDCEQQTSMFGPDPVCEMGKLGVALGLYFKRMTQTCDPSKGVKDIVKYIKAGENYTNGQRQTGLDFGGSTMFDKDDPSEYGEVAYTIFVNHTLPPRLAQELVSNPQESELSNVRKEIAPHMFVIFKISDDEYGISLGDPTHGRSRLKYKGSKNDIEDWIYEGNASENLIIDTTKAGFVSPFYTQWYVDNMMKVVVPRNIELLILNALPDRFASVVQEIEEDAGLMGEIDEEQQQMFREYIIEYLSKIMEKKSSLKKELMRSKSIESLEANFKDDLSDLEKIKKMFDDNLSPMSKNEILEQTKNYFIRKYEHPPEEPITEKYLFDYVKKALEKLHAEVRTEIMPKLQEQSMRQFEKDRYIKLDRTIYKELYALKENFKDPKIRNTHLYNVAVALHEIFKNDEWKNYLWEGDSFNLKKTLSKAFLHRSNEAKALHKSGAKTKTAILNRFYDLLEAIGIPDMVINAFKKTVEVGRVEKEDKPSESPFKTDVEEPYYVDIRGLKGTYEGQDFEAMGWKTNVGSCDVPSEFFAKFAHRNNKIWIHDKNYSFKTPLKEFADKKIKAAGKYDIGKKFPFVRPFYSEKYSLREHKKDACGSGSGRYFYTDQVAQFYKDSVLGVTPMCHYKGYYGLSKENKDMVMKMQNRLHYIRTKDHKKRTPIVTEYLRLFNANVCKTTRSGTDQRYYIANPDPVNIGYSSGSLKMLIAMPLDTDFFEFMNDNVDKWLEGTDDVGFEKEEVTLHHSHPKLPIDLYVHAHIRNGLTEYFAIYRMMDMQISIFSVAGHTSAVQAWGSNKRVLIDDGQYKDILLMGGGDISPRRQNAKTYFLKVLNHMKDFSGAKEKPKSKPKSRGKGKTYDKNPTTAHMQRIFDALKDNYGADIKKFVSANFWLDAKQNKVSFIRPKGSGFLRMSELGKVKITIPMFKKMAFSNNEIERKLVARSFIFKFFIWTNEYNQVAIYNVTSLSNQPPKSIFMGFGEDGHIESKRALLISDHSDMGKNEFKENLPQLIQALPIEETAKAMYEYILSILKEIRNEEEWQETSKDYADKVVK